MSNVLDISSKNSYLTTKQWEEVVEYVKSRNNVADEAVEIKNSEMIYETEISCNDITETPSNEQAVFDILIEQPDLESLYNKLFELAETDIDSLYAMTTDELERLKSRTDELYAAISNSTDMDNESYSMLMEMWDILSTCPDCGLENGEHEEDCPRSMIAVMPADGLSISANRSIGATTISGSNTSWNFTANATVTLTGIIIIPDGKKLTINANGYAAKIIANGNLTTRNQAMFHVQDGGSLVINGVVIDGGAVWGGAEDEAVKRGSVNSGFQNGLIRVNHQTTKNDAYELVITNCILQNSQHDYPIFIGRSADVQFVGGAVANCEAMITDNATSIEGIITIKASNDTATRTFTMTETKLYGNKVVTGSGGVFRTNGSTMVDMSLSGIEMYNNYSSGWGNILWNAKGECVIENSTFTHNTSARRGGAISSEGHGVKISNCSFINNSAEEYGGAIAIFSYQSANNPDGIDYDIDVVIDEGCVFQNNSAPHGGAISCQVTKSNNETDNTRFHLIVDVAGKFNNNTASIDGGAIYIEKIDEKSTGELDVTGGTISDNSSTQNGGAIYVSDGDVYISGGTISNNTATGNGGAISVENGNVMMSGGIIKTGKAENGGGIYVNGGKFEISNGVVQSNGAIKNGGGTYVNGGNFIMTNGTFDNNTSEISGGAVYITDGNVNIDSGTITNNIALDKGGAIAVTSGDLIIGLEECHDAGESSTHTHPVIEGNVASDGGGIYVDGGITTMWCGDIKQNLTYDKTVNVLVISGGNFVYNGGTIGIPYDSGVFVNGGVFEDNSEESTDAIKHELHYHSVLGNETHNGRIPESKWIASPRGDVINVTDYDSSSVTWADLYPEYEFVGWESNEKNDTDEVVNLYAIWERK